MFLYRIVLPLEDLVKRAPFSSQLVTVQPIVRKLVSESFKCLLSACAELDHWTPCLRLPFEVLDECDEGNRCRGGRVGGCQQLHASSTCPYTYTAEKGTHLHVVDTLVEDKFGQTRRVATERTRQSPKHRAKLAVRLALVRLCCFSSVSSLLICPYYP